MNAKKKLNVSKNKLKSTQFIEQKFEITVCSTKFKNLGERKLVCYLRSPFTSEIRQIRGNCLYLYC